jgi:hypothetical protein
MSGPLRSRKQASRAPLRQLEDESAHLRQERPEQQPEHREVIGPRLDGAPAYPLARNFFTTVAFAVNGFDKISYGTLSAFGFGRRCSKLPVRGAAGVLSATPVTDSLRRSGSDFVVFCFSESEDAKAFAKRFGGELFRAGH